MKPSIFAVCTLAAIAAPFAGRAQAPAPLPAAAAFAAPPYGAPITLEQAKAVMAAAEAEARKRNVAVTIVVVEPNGTIVLSERMNGASYASAETAPNKARSAAAWKLPTSYWIEAMRNNPGVIGMAHVVAANGGEVIVSGGLTIGAIGVGGSGPNEGEIAKIAVASLK